MLDPHGMDPQTVLRFVRAVGGWPGKVIVIACEPAEVEEMGLGLTRRRSAPSGRRAAVELVGVDVHELSLSRRGHRHRRAPRGRAPRDRRLPAGRPPAPGRARVARVLLRARRARHACARARVWSRSSSRRACAAAAATSGSSTGSTSAARPAARPTRRSSAARSFWWNRSTSSNRRPHAPREGQGRRGRAGRQQHDRPRQPRRLRRPRRHRDQPHELAGGGQDDAARGAAGRRDRRRARRRARGRRAGLDGRRPAGQPARAGDPAQHRPGLRRRVPPRRQHGALARCPRCRCTTSTCSSSRTSATSCARPSSTSARTPA